LFALLLLAATVVGYIFWAGRSTAVIGLFLRHRTVLQQQNTRRNDQQLPQLLRQHNPDAQISPELQVQIEEFQRQAAEAAAKAAASLNLLSKRYT
jgi:hypothetical protein